jgi:Uncharacterized protein conserved in bacteria
LGRAITVIVTMEIDKEERRVTKPEDFTKALSKSKKAALLFAALSYPQQKEYVDWILGAKQDETRANRIEKTMQMLSDGLGTAERATCSAAGAR